MFASKKKELLNITIKTDDIMNRYPIFYITEPNINIITLKPVGKLFICTHSYDLFDIFAMLKIIALYNVTQKFVFVGAEQSYRGFNYTKLWNILISIIFYKYSILKSVSTDHCFSKEGFNRTASIIKHLNAGTNVIMFIYPNKTRLSHNLFDICNTCNVKYLYFCKIQAPHHEGWWCTGKEGTIVDRLQLLLQEILTVTINKVNISMHKNNLELFRGLIKELYP